MAAAKKMVQPAKPKARSASVKALPAKKAAGVKGGVLYRKGDDL
jgi:hypothetical protein